MTALCIIVAVLLMIVVILLIPLGAEAEYDEPGVTAWLRIGPLRMVLYPRPPKPEGKEKSEKKKKEKKKKEAAEDEQPKKGGTLKLIKEIIPVGIEALGSFRRSLIIKKLSLYFCFGGEDPASVARGFGGMNAGAGMIVPLLQQHFRVKELDVRSSVDFAAAETRVYAHADLRVRTAALIAIALRAGVKALRIYLRNNKEAKAAAPAAQPRKAEKGK